MALGTSVLLSADQYYQNYGNRQNSCSSCNNSWRTYQCQDQNDNYSRHYQRRSSPDYDQREGQNTQRNNRYQYQAPSSPQQFYDQNQQYDPQYDPHYMPQYDTQYDTQYDQQHLQQPANQELQKSDERLYESKKESKNVAVSDQEIKQKIKDTMNSVWFSKGFENVSYEVNYGNVDLNGSVETSEDKHKIEDSVKKISGVRQVNNQLTIEKK